MYAPPMKRIPVMQLYTPASKPALQLKHWSLMTMVIQLDIDLPGIVLVALVGSIKGPAAFVSIRRATLKRSTDAIIMGCNATRSRRLALARCFRWRGAQFPNRSVCT